MHASQKPLDPNIYPNVPNDPYFKHKFLIHWLVLLEVSRKA